MGAVSDKLGGKSSSSTSSKSKDVGDIKKSISSTAAKLAATPAAAQAAEVPKHHESWWQKALNVVTIPQKVIVSGANELGQGLNALLTPNHDPNDPRFHGSWKEFTQGIGDYKGKHRGVGVGDIIEDAHPDAPIWVKRGAGFAGDILTDPLTYLAPEEHLAKLGRIGTATKIAEAAKAAEVAGDGAKAARLLEDAARVGEKGIAHSSTEGLEAIGARGGVMFNVPGTGRIARGVRRTVGMEPGELIQLQVISRQSGTGKGLSAIAKGFDTVFSKGKKLDVVAHVLDKFGGEEGRAALKRDVASGDPEKIYAATKGLHAKNLAVAEEQRFAHAVETEMNTIFKAGKKHGISGEDLSLASQGSAEAFERIAAKSPETAARVRPFFDGAHERLNALLPEGGKLPYLENYGTRQLSDNAAQILGIGKHGEFARGGVAGFEMKRKLVEGETFLGRKLVSAAEHPEGLTVEQQITDALRQAVKDGKIEGAQKALLEAGIDGDVHMFNPDAYESWPRYVRAMAKRAGFAKQESYLREAGVWADRGKFVNVLEEAKAKLQAAKEAAVSPKLDAAAKAAAVEEARVAVVRAHEMLAGVNEAAAAHVEGAARAVQQTVENLQLPVKEAEALRSYADEFFGAPIESLQHEAQSVTDNIATHTETLASSYEGLDAAAAEYRSAVAKQDFLNGEIRRIQEGLSGGTPGLPAELRVTEGLVAHPLTQAQHADPYGGIAEGNLRLFRGEQPGGFMHGDRLKDPTASIEETASRYFATNYMHAKGFGGGGKLPGEVYHVDVAKPQFEELFAHRTGKTFDELLAQQQAGGGKPMAWWKEDVKALDAPARIESKVATSNPKLAQLEALRADIGHAVSTTSSNLHDAQGIAQANASRLSELEAQAVGVKDAIDLKEQFLRSEAKAHYEAAAGFEAQVKAAAAADATAAVADGQNAMTRVLIANYTAQGKVAEAEAMLRDAKAAAGKAGTRAKKVELAVQELDDKIKRLVVEIEADPTKAERFVETYRGAMQPIGRNGVADPVIIESMAASAKAVMHKDIGALLKQYDKLQNVWKAYALATPGWHFRNVFGDMWNNYLDDIEIGRYHLYRRLNRAYHNGTLAESTKFSREEIDAFTTWKEHGAAWGRGTAYDIETHPLQGANINPLSRDFAPLKLNQAAGERVEEVLRGAHALDRLLKGDTIEEAMARVYRFHGDYSDLSQFERNVVKRVIPFYTWSRKVLPLQVEMLIRQPNKFARFGQLKNEVEAESENPDFVPGYFLSQLSIRTPFQSGGGNVYVDPHLPFQDVTKFNSLENVLSNVTPLIKTPMELVAGKRFFTGQPFNGKYQPIPGAWQKIPGFTQVAATLGFAKKGADGQWMMTDRNLYKVENSLPIFGQTRRLLPSETKYQERALTSYLSFFLGAGVRANTTSDQSSEALRQLFKLQQISAEQKSLGYDTSAKAGNASTVASKLAGLTG